MAPVTAAYGTWESRITPKTLTERTVTLSQVRTDGHDVYWVENNPRRPGRSVLLVRNAMAQTREVLPLLEGSRLVDVATDVHGRGGRAYAVKDGKLVISDGEDNRVYFFDTSARKRELVPLTQLGAKLYGDFEIDLERGLVYAVAEDRNPTNGASEPENYLVSIPLDGSAARDESRILTVFSGTDFVSSPALSPDGSKLAWLTWDHPEMPWTKSELHVGELGAAGTLLSDVVIVDHPEVCAYEPRWSLEGDLIHVDDSTGWANLYRTEGFRVRAGEPADAWQTRLRTRALHPGARAFSRPHWQLGLHSYDNLDNNHLVCAWAEGAHWHIGTIRLDNGLLEEWELGWQPVGNIAVAADRVVFLGGNPDHLPAVIEVIGGKARIVRPSSETELDGDAISRAEHVTWQNRDGSEGRGLFYAPVSAEFVGPEGSLPPLIVRTHSVPTSSARADMDVATQYWTSRGFAVFCPNYRGSTGHGRKYREELNGRWGELDVKDTVDGVKFLTSRSLIDPERIAIRGESFGGMTVLSALETSDIFSAGVIDSGITDLRAFLKYTQKFVSHYPRRLTGISDPDDTRVKEVSPLENLDKVTAPVLFLHGTDDQLAPVAQAETAYRSLTEKGRPAALVLFPDEGHIFTSDAAIEEAWQTELAFYCEIWGIHSPEEFPVEIANWN